MVVFQAPSDKSARGLYKLIKKMFKKSAKKYELGFELLAVSEDSRLTSLLYEEN